MTQHELLEEGIDLERGAKRIAEINATRIPTETVQVADGTMTVASRHLEEFPDPPARKPRSDKGIMRETLYITPAKGVRLDISEPTGKAYLCDIMGRYAKAEYAEELASIGAQLLAIIERRK